VLEHIGRVAFDAPAAAAAVPDYFIAMVSPFHPDNHQEEREFVLKLKEQIEYVLEVRQRLREYSRAIEELKDHVRITQPNPNDGPMSDLLGQMIALHSQMTEDRNLALENIWKAFHSHQHLFWEAVYRVEL
jgi:hypothetical protein